VCWTCERRREASLLNVYPRYVDIRERSCQSWWLHRCSVWLWM